ncbi:MAG: beta-ketoacyl synthase N-terminal-like domain-containing protein [Victivallales bacterium]
MGNSPVIVSADLITAYGHGLNQCWDGFMARHRPFTPITRFPTTGIEEVVAATVPDFSYESTMSLAERLLREIAMTTVGLPADTELFLATTVGEIDLLEQEILLHRPDKCASTCNSLLAKAKAIFEKEHASLISAACASGNMALARAAAKIQSGAIEYAIVAGCDIVSEFVFSGFASLGAIDLKGARPYDRERAGLTLGEAAAVIVLASEDATRRDGLPRLARLAGWNMTCDAVHITAPRSDGLQLVNAIRHVLDTAVIAPSEIGGVIGHGTGTIFNDSMEINALNAVFNKNAKPLFSTKGGVGHTLGAAGIIQTAVAVKAIQELLLPPQTGLREPMPGAEHMVSNQAQKLIAPKILSLSSGFGGINAVLLIEECP